MATRSVAVEGRLRMPGAAWLVVCVLAALPIFWFGFGRLLQEWAQPEFRFKGVIPAFSLLMFLQVLRTLPPEEPPSRGTWLGLAIVLGAFFFAVAGIALDIEDLIFGSMIVWVAGILVVSFGFPRALVFWAPVASLTMMIPVPRLVLTPLHRFLETVATDIAAGALRLLGIPMRVEGRNFDFGIHQVPVSEATQGLVNFLPVLLIFFLFASVSRGPLWSRLVPLFLAAPVMVVLTSVRIVLIGLAIDRAGASGSERVLALTGDWIFLAATVLVLLGIVRLLLTIVGHRAQIVRMIDLDIRGLGGQLARVSRIVPSRPMIATAIVSVACSVAFIAGPSRPYTPVERDNFSMFPPDVGGWTGTKSTVTPGIANVLGADDFVLIDYYHPDERASVNFWSAFYHRQGRGTGAIHSPQNCLPNDSWTILSLQSTEVEVPRGGAGPMNVNKAVIEKDGMRALMYYWYDGRGRRLTNERYARLLVQVDGLLENRTDGALVRYVTAILPDESEAAADARIQRLMADTVGLLPRFVPE